MPWTEYTLIAEGIVLCKIQDIPMSLLYIKLLLNLLKWLPHRHIIWFFFMNWAYHDTEWLVNSSKTTLLSEISWRPKICISFIQPQTTFTVFGKKVNFVYTIFTYTSLCP